MNVAVVVKCYIEFVSEQQVIDLKEYLKEKQQRSYFVGTVESKTLEEIEREDLKK